MPQDFFGFPPHIAALIAGVGTVYVAFSYSPFWLPALVAYRRGRSLDRRFLFVFLIAVIAYGLFAFLALAIAVPLTLFMVYVAPTLANSGYLQSSIFIKAIDFAINYWWLGYGPLLMLTTILVTRSIADRWNALVAVWANNSFKPKPLRGSA